jgi:hypothetical protein
VFRSRFEKRIPRHKSRIFPLQKPAQSTSYRIVLRLSNMSHQINVFNPHVKAYNDGSFECNSVISYAALRDEHLTWDLQSSIFNSIYIFFYVRIAAES